MDNTAREISELRFNVDDMTGEELGFAMDRLFEAGAADVFITPVYMKKSRPGQLVTVVCPAELREKMAETIFKYTSTLGIRETLCSRYILSREEKVWETSFGPVNVKTSEGFGVKKVKCEYEDVKRIAAEMGIGLKEAREMVMKELNGGH